ncbi:tRNA (guanosine(46)-N7)-methyltransferase TrmB [Candidatus Poribacteria bacterium]|nr:tRNA (guanosine(46)-N7)-methyltransferase TrmB [Candidatus Poribacteria bacterium]
MRENPNYNEIYYQHTTSHSQVIDIVTEQVVPLSELEAPIDWESLFGNVYPVEIEIGSGKGRFLLEASKRHPKVNYIGVERAQKYVEITQDRFEKHIRHFSVDRTSGTFSNVRLVRTDANYFLTRYVPETSVQAYHIYFPDPWPRKRQRKRRLFRNRDFLEALTRTLKSEGGRLYIVTDHAEYFQEIQERLADLPVLHLIHAALRPDSDITTHYEAKYALEGRPIYRVVYEKVSS